MNNYGSTANQANNVNINNQNLLGFEGRDGVESTENSCLQSLSFPEMRQRENDISNAANSTCRWLIQHPTYLSWSLEQSGLLSVKGHPGVGKSTVMKHARRTDIGNGNTIIASHFFHGRGGLIQKNALGLFRSLLHQILQRLPVLLSKFAEIYKHRVKTEGQCGKRWDWHANELQEFFESEITKAAEGCTIRIYIDAIDECGAEVAMHLVSIFQRVAGYVSICFSCRHYPLIALEKQLEINVEDENMQDIEAYVTDQLNLHNLRNEYKTTIHEEIMGRSSRNFQWVALVISIVIGLYKSRKPLALIQRRIREIPSELKDLYQQLLEDIDDVSRPQTLHLFQWICFARKPLSLKAFNAVMAVEEGTHQELMHQWENPKEYPDKEDDMKIRLCDLSKGLAEVVLHQDRQIVQLIHQSVFDFLLAHGFQRLGIFQHVKSNDSLVGRSHFWLAKICIEYLAFCAKTTFFEPEALARVQSSATNDRGKFIDIPRFVLRANFPFFEYATAHWCAHVAMVEQEELPVADLLSPFYPPSDILRCWIDNYKASYWIGGVDSYLFRLNRNRTTILHIIAALNLLSGLDAAIDRGLAADSKDGNEETPLLLAARSGHEAMVRALLDRHDVFADWKDKQGRTPLSYAAKEGLFVIIELLIARDDVKVDSKDINGRTPLSHTAQSGHKEVVKVLANRPDVVADSKDKYSRTPLSYAAQSGYEEVVKILANRPDVVADSKDISGRTPLSHAARGGHKEVVKVLANRSDVVADSMDNFGSTPLHLAVSHNKIKVAEVLLARDDVSADIRDRNGHTPFSWAVILGSEAIVRLLLERRDIKLEAKQQALEEAVSEGKRRIVKMLEASIRGEPLIPTDGDETEW